MNTIQYDVEAIVREVIRRLSEMKGDKSAIAALQAVESPAKDADSLTIDQRLVTLETLHRRLNNMKRVIVPRKAIVTPSVVDLLKEKRIELVFGGDGKAGESSKRSLVVATSENTAGGEGWLRFVEGCRRIEAKGLKDAVEKLSAEAKSGERVLLWTKQVAAGVCLANRNSWIRAISAGNEAELNSAMREVSANMLVINPQMHSQYQFKAIVKAFNEYQSSNQPAV